jgi:hypothetical protein
MTALVRPLRRVDVLAVAHANRRPAYSHAAHEVAGQTS